MPHSLSGSFHGITLIAMAIAVITMCSTTQGASAGHAIMRKDTHRHIAFESSGSLYESAGDSDNATNDATDTNDTNATDDDLWVEPTDRYQFMVRLVRYSPACLRLDHETFQRYDCDRHDPQQQFFAMGIDPTASPVSRYAHNISGYNGNIFCYTMGDKIEATDPQTHCATHAKNVDISPAYGTDTNDISGCRRLKWKMNGDATQADPCDPLPNDENGFQMTIKACMPRDICMGPSNGDQDALASQIYCLEDEHYANQTKVAWDPTAANGLFVIFKNNNNTLDDPLPAQIDCPAT